MKRRMFDHLFAEISVAAGVRVPRYPLWMEMHDRDWDPETMTVGQALTYLDGPLKGFLVEHGLGMSAKARRRMRRAVAHFSPNHPTPSERLQAWATRH